MNKIYFVFLFILLCSCSMEIKYLGTSYEPTKEPDFYVDAESIDRPYKIIGKGYPHMTAFNHAIEKLQRKALEKAKKKGADAVLINDYYISNTGASINSTYRSDSLGKGLITFGNSTVTNTGSSGFTILFLKYTDR